MTTPDKNKKTDDILTDLENQPAPKKSKLQSAFGFAAAIGELCVKAKNVAVDAFNYANRVYQIPGVKRTIYSPFGKAETPTEKAIAVGALAAGVTVGYLTYGTSFTVMGSGFLGSVVAAKGTQIGLGLCKRLMFNKKASPVPEYTVDDTPVQKSQADAEMGEDSTPKKPKITGNKSDHNIF
tara:strand:+ start:202422 stop:202964 length:543 start_codon:yes stop_codon:yes gene_type:complete